MVTNPKIGFIGFGEIAYYFSKGLKGQGCSQISAYDKDFDELKLGNMIRDRARNADVELMPTIEDLVQWADLLISAVWGNASLEVAEKAANLITPGKIFADINNTNPSVKRAGSKAINAKGAKYVDIALFDTPVQKGLKSFMLISGDGAKEFDDIMTRLGLNIKIVQGEAGDATTIKTLANIYYKGTQALLLELALCALKAEVDIEFLAPLLRKPVEGLPPEEEMAFWIMRGAIHAERKAAELKNVIGEIKRWDVDPIMSEAMMERLRNIGQYRLNDYFKGGFPINRYKEILEAITNINIESKTGLK